MDAHARYRKWTMNEISDRLVDAGFRIDEQRYLEVKKKSERDAASEDRAGLLYLSAKINNRQPFEQAADLAAGE